MAIKNVISATHANAGFAIYNCSVIDETRSGRRQEGNLLYIRTYVFYCTRVIIHARAKDVHHNAQKSRKKANGERISYFRIRKKEIRFERSAAEVSIVFSCFFLSCTIVHFFVSQSVLDINASKVDYENSARNSLRVTLMR